MRAANGLTIPNVGFIELDVSYNGKYKPQRGFLIVKDSNDEYTQKHYFRMKSSARVPAHLLLLLYSCARGISRHVYLWIIVNSTRKTSKTSFRYPE